MNFSNLSESILLENCVFSYFSRTFRPKNRIFSSRIGEKMIWSTVFGYAESFPTIRGRFFDPEKNSIFSYSVFFVVKIRFFAIFQTHGDNLKNVKIVFLSSLLVISDIFPLEFTQFQELTKKNICGLICSKKKMRRRSC